MGEENLNYWTLCTPLIYAIAHYTHELSQWRTKAVQGWVINQYVQIFEIKSTFLKKNKQHADVIFIQNNLKSNNMRKDLFLFLKIRKKDKKASKAI